MKTLLRFIWLVLGAAAAVAVVALALSVPTPAPLAAGARDIPSPDMTPTIGAQVFLPIIRTAATVDPNAWQHAPTPTRKPIVDASVLSWADVWGVDGQNILHWNGEVWAVQSPNTPDAHSIRMLSDTDGWVACCGGLRRWDGQSWSSSLVFSGRGVVEALPSGDAWVLSSEPIDIRVGSTGWMCANHFWHWDGATWVEAAPPPIPLCVDLAMHATAPDDLTLRGTSIWFDDRRPSYERRTFHWDGAAWAFTP